MKKILFILLILLTFSISAETITTSGYNSVTNSGGAWDETLITVDISLHTAITFDVDYGEDGDAEKFDKFEIHYRLDGGVWDKPVKIKNDQAPASLSLTGLEGALLEIKIRMLNDDNAETWWYDNLIVTGTPIPLPVELLYFTVKEDVDHIIFDWATASEINNEYFEIEKSIDGIVFSTISFLEGAGNSTNIIYYSIKTITHSGYFRLKQVDYDGTTTYSKILFTLSKIESKMVVGEYDLQGRPVNGNYRGITIIKYSDGTYKKTLK